MYVPQLQTPSQAAWEESTEEIRLFYTPVGYTGSLPYFGGFLTLLAFVLTLASVQSPWYYVGGGEAVVTSGRGSSTYFGYTVRLSQVDLCTSYAPFTGSTSEGGESAGNWFDGYSCSLVPFDGKNLSTSAFQATFQATLALSSLSLASFAASFVLPLAPAYCGGGCDLRPAPGGGPMTLAHFRVLGLKLLGAVLLLSALLSSTLGQPSDAIYKALASPKPGILDGPGLTLGKVATGLAFAAVAMELGYLLGMAAHLSYVKTLGFAPAPPPPEPLPPTELQQRAITQGLAMLESGQMAALSPQPLLPEDLRAYSVPNITTGASGGVSSTFPLSGGPLPQGAAGEGGGGSPNLLDLYHCRHRMYSGALLHENALPQEAPGAAVEEVRLVLSTGLRSKQRVTVRLGEDGSLLAPTNGGGGGMLPVLQGIVAQPQVLPVATAPPAPLGYPLSA